MTPIEMSDDARLDRLEDMLDRLTEGFANANAWRELSRRRAVDRIRGGFFHPVQGGLQPIPIRRYLGLGWSRYGGQFRGTFQYAHAARRVGICSPVAPWGWRWLKEEDRNVAICLPLWLYWPIRLRREWRHYLYEPLMHLGFWKIDDGDWYWNGRWTWQFWRTLHWYRIGPLHPDPSYPGFDQPPAGRWERFGWALRNVVWCFLHDADSASVPVVERRQRVVF